MAEHALGGRYELRERIGAGGMGAVYRALDAKDGTEVAVKVIRPEISSETGSERFAREAKHTAKVRHPHVVEVLDSGVSDEGELYLVMELLDGVSLEERLEILPPPTVPEVIDWMAEALDGLGAVHGGGIIHRDLKPGNLFLAREGAVTKVKVLDFGLARSVVADEDGKPLPSLTQTHQFLGTPYYMSPEQVRSAKHIDHRADLFSIGVILYEALAGRRPFDGRSASAVIAAIVADEPPELGALRPDLPPALLAVVRRALCRKSVDRFDDAASMRDALLTARGASGDLRVTPRDVSGTAPTAVDETPRRPPMTPYTRPGDVPTRRGAGRALVVGLSAVAIAAIAGAAYLLPGETTDSVDAGAQPPLVEAAPIAAEVAAGPMRLALPDDLASLCERFREIPGGAARHGVRFVEGPDDWVMVALADVAPSAARRMAARMGAEAVPFDGDLSGAFTPELYATKVSLNVRDQPNARGALIRTLPRDTIVVGLSGTHEGQPSEFGTSGAWIRVVAGPRHIGWSASSFLREDSGCLPRVDAVLEVLGVAEAEAYYDDTLVGRSTFNEDDASYGGFLVVARSEELNRSIVGVVRRDEVCDLEAEVVVPIHGWVVDVLRAQASQDTGETLMFIGRQDGPAVAEDGVETWTGHRLGDPGAVFEMTAVSSHSIPTRRRAHFRVQVERGPPDARRYYPLAIKRPGDRTFSEFYAWDGEGLYRAEEPPPVPPPDAGAPEAATPEAATPETE